MAAIIWSNKSIDDLVELEAFAEKISTDYAPYLISKILEAEKQLARFPRSGRVVPELNLPTIRELLVNNYRLIYLLDDLQIVRIITIRHSAVPFDVFPLN